MEFMEGFLEDNEVNNRCIQRALREIDEHTLLCAMSELDERSCQAILRNMSKRAAEGILADIKASGSSVSQGQRYRSREDFLQRLRKFRKYSGESGGAPASADAKALDSPEDIVRFFTALSRALQSESPPDLGKLAAGCGDALARKGLEYLGDGLDPLLTRSLLERRKATATQLLETRYAMMLEGFDAIAQRDLPGIVEEKLRAFTATAGDGFAR